MIQPCPVHSWLGSFLFPLSQGMDRCLPEAWHRILLPPLWAVTNLPGYCCLQPEWPPFSTGLFWELCFPETSNLVPSVCDWKAPFFAFLGWVYGFRPISDQESKTAPQWRNFRHEWADGWGILGGRDFCLCAPETTPPSASVLETPPILENAWALFLSLALSSET